MLKEEDDQEWSRIMCHCLFKKNELTFFHRFNNFLIAGLNYERKSGKRGEMFGFEPFKTFHARMD